MCDLAVIVGPYNPENLEGQLIFDEPWVAMIPVAHVLNAYELTEQNVGIAIYPAAAAIYADSRKVITKKLIDPSVTASYYLTQRKEKNSPLLRKSFGNILCKIYNCDS